MTMCNLIASYQQAGGTCCLHLKCKRLFYSYVHTLLLSTAVFQQKLMEAGNRANKSGVKPIQEAAILPVKLQYFFFMKSETAQVKTHEEKGGVLFESSLQKL